MVDGRAAAILQWYASHARDLPWRRPDAGPWAVLVSEIMLQQTPVNRVLPAYQAWLSRWPTPAALAAEPPGEAVRAWGRLGYPRRALRLHECAHAIVDRHGGAERQVRGLVLAALRGSETPVSQGTLDLVWPDATQRSRALDGLIADGLVDPLPDGRFGLPMGLPSSTP